MLQSSTLSVLFIFLFQSSHTLINLLEEEESLHLHLSYFSSLEVFFLLYQGLSPFLMSTMPSDSYFFLPLYISSLGHCASLSVFVMAHYNKKSKRKASAISQKKFVDTILTPIFDLEHIRITKSNSQTIKQIRGMDSIRFKD